MLPGNQETVLDHTGKILTPKIVMSKGYRYQSPWVGMMPGYSFNPSVLCFPIFLSR